jgi:precorrin-6B methylase 2
MLNLAFFVIYRSLEYIFDEMRHSVLFVHQLVVHIPRMVQTYFDDRRLGIDCCMHRDASLSFTSPYRRVEVILDSLELVPTDIFVDIGCCTGRVLCLALLKKVRKVIGIEINERFVRRARENIAVVIAAHGGVAEIITVDAAQYIPCEGTVFFMANPFGIETLAMVINNIHASLEANPRRIKIVYSNPRFAVYLDAHSWLRRVGELHPPGQTKVVVWENLHPLSIAPSSTPA